MTAPGGTLRFAQIPGVRSSHGFVRIRGFWIIGGKIMGAAHGTLRSMG